ncbi:MAG: hypothetical protein KC503_20910 [Myxococcales bacterium]|nr:hypothetical protein [Myxococcales bacterium]
MQQRRTFIRHTIAFLLAVSLCTIGARAHAQQLDHSEDAHLTLKLTSARYRSALTMRGVGIALTIIGGVVTTVTGVVIGVGSTLCNAFEGIAHAEGPPSDCTPSTPGVAVLGAGAATLVAGLVLAITGHQRVGNMRRRFLFSVAPTAGGAAATVALRF